MEDADGALSFDFEGGLDAIGPVAHPSSAVSLIAPTPSGPASYSAAGVIGSGGPNNLGRRTFRQTVCWHWLRSLCMKGDLCGFLHQYDKSRMPICRFFRQYGGSRI